MESYRAAYPFKQASKVNGVARKWDHIRRRGMGCEVIGCPAKIMHFNNGVLGGFNWCHRKGLERELGLDGVGVRTKMAAAHSVGLVDAVANVTILMCNDHHTQHDNVLGQFGSGGGVKNDGVYTNTYKRSIVRAMWAPDVRETYYNEIIQTYQDARMRNGGNNIPADGYPVR